MKNPTYAGDFAPSPMPERAAAIDPLVAQDQLPVLSIGIKTITHNRSGHKLQPHEVLVIEMLAGEELASFDIPPSWARHYADRLNEFAEAIEAKKAS